MNAALLLENYAQIADAPDAIARLRRFVLDLAVRGKLVEQDADDEPASLLLKRIATEKARMVNAGSLRKPRELDNGGELPEPFPIPAAWRWLRLDNVGAIIGGGTPSAGDADNFAEPGAGIPWLTPADLGGYSGLYISRGARDLSDKGSRASSATVMPTGSVLFTSRAPIGYVAIAANPISTNQGFKSIIPYVADCSRFIALAMTAFSPEIDAKAPGTTFKEVSGKIVAAFPFPLPPLAEQHRIVAKADELMALCDQLEAARAECEHSRDRLALSTLAKLNTPDPETFGQDVRFALANLAPLTARADQIKQLRQTILSLAVRGKLVEQGPSDEPASELLKQIAADRAKLTAAGKLRITKPLPNIEPDEFSGEIPAGWCLSRLGDITKLWNGFAFKSSDFQTSGVPVIRIGDLQDGEVNLSSAVCVSDHISNSLGNGFWIPEGALLLAMSGATTGKTAFNNTGQRLLLNQRVGRIEPFRMNIKFIKFFFETIIARNLSISFGTAIPNLSAQQINETLIPLPPLAEQHRIVTKVDELMALCDQLEASITTGEQTRSRLLESVLHNALEPA